MKTVIGLFNTIDRARDVVTALVDAGFDRDNISLVANDAEGKYANVGEDTGAEGAAVGAGTGAVIGGLGGLLLGLGALAIPGIGPIIAAGPIAAALAGAGIGAVAGGLIGALADMGVPEEQAQYYAEGVRRGGALVILRTDDAMADRGADIMNRFGALNVDDRVAAWRQEGWTGFDENAEPYTTEQVTAYRDRYETADLGTDRDMDVQRMRDFEERPVEDRYRATDVEGETTIPVIEEDIDIGKRQVQRGGVRVFTHVTEQPVEEQVTLREEHVNVERRPVDRPISTADMDAFKEGTIEVTETVEEPVVRKEARVIEEIVISKDVDTHTETVRDTVRRTDVDVQNLQDQWTRVEGDWNTYEPTFRRDYDTNFANTGYTYDQYMPAYRYGYTLGTHERYAGREWNDIEPEARRYWEERNPGTWDRFKDAVRNAWNDVRDAV